MRQKVVGKFYGSKIVGLSDLNGVFYSIGDKRYLKRQLEENVCALLSLSSLLDYLCN